MAYRLWRQQPMTKRVQASARRNDLIIKHYRCKVVYMENELCKIKDILDSDKPALKRVAESRDLLESLMRYCHNHRGRDERDEAAS